MIQIIAGLSIALALLAGGGWLYVKSLRAERAMFEQAYAIAAQTAVDNQKVLDAEIKERARVDGILLEHRNQLQRKEASNAILNRALDALKNSDQAVSDYMRQPVPDPVARLLNNPDPAGQHQGGETIPAGGVGSAQPATADPDPD